MHTTPADTSGFEEEHLNCYLARVLQTVDRAVHPELDLGLHHNTVYTQGQLLDLLTYISLEGEFANSGAKTRRLRHGGEALLRNDRRSSLAKALGYHLRGLEPAQIQTQFDSIFEEIRAVATQARLLTGPVEIAIDEHEWLFYGEDETEMVTHTDPGQGTDLAFTFLTACVVSPGVRLTIGAVPVGPETDIGRALIRVLGPVSEWLEIRRVYMDRGFYEVRVLQALEALDLEYLVRARQFPSLAEGPVATVVEEGYEVGGSRPPYDTVRVTRFAVPHAEFPEEKQTYFVTNGRVSEESAEGYAELYRRRWGIETSYRMIGEFLARSTSREFSVRLYYFLYAVMLYDLWILTTVMMSVRVREEMDRPVMSSRVFARLFEEHWVSDLPPPG